MTRSPISGVDNALIAKLSERLAGTGQPPSSAEAEELFTEFKKLEHEVRKLGLGLDEARSILKGLAKCIPFCASCEKIPNAELVWKQLEQRIRRFTDPSFSLDPRPGLDAKDLLPSRGPQPCSSQTISNLMGMLGEAELNDPIINKLKPIFDNDQLIETPLFGDFCQLFEKYVRQSRRMTRIAKISDIFQSELQDAKAKLEESSRTDFLTGLHNRRNMYEIIEIELSRARRHGKAFAIIMADLDHFKSINDAYGHDIGDEVLKVVAKTLKENLRKEDSCGRWGGEEFLALLPVTDQEQALNVAEKIRVKFAEISIDVNGGTVRLTASLGISVFQSGETIRTCISRADDALYRAKASGRNSVVML